MSLSSERKYHTGDAVVIISPLLGEDEHEEHLTEEEKAALGTLSPGRRRAEWATWRAMARRELGSGVGISYDGIGRPVLAGSEYHIGVSHTKGAAAIIISGRPCSIDIEDCRRNFSRAANRYISSVERALPAAHDPLFEGAVWCIKEAVYKLMGCRDVEFSKDIEVTSLDMATGRVTALFRRPASEPGGRLATSTAGQEEVGATKATGHGGGQELSLTFFREEEIIGVYGVL